jgi:dienelactone hydrolase
MEQQVAPYGAWRSPVSVDAVLKAGVSISGLVADGDAVLWLESRPDQDNRVTVMRYSQGTITELTPYPISVRSRVNEYGGGAMHSRGGSVAWCDDRDNSVWLSTPEGRPFKVADGGTTYRFGDLRVEPTMPAVLAVREEHTPGGVITTIVALPWQPTGQPGSGEVICHGADFYADPELSNENLLAWSEWNQPDMPWDACTIQLGEIRAWNGHVSVRRLGPVDGGPALGEDGVSAQHPKWLPDGRLAYVCDDSGFWNIKIWDGQTAKPAHHSDHDYSIPAWVLGNTDFAVLDSQHLVVTRLEDGFAFLEILNLATAETTPLASASPFPEVAASGGIGYAIIERPNSPAAVVKLSPNAPASVIRQPEDSPDSKLISVAKSLTFTGRHGRVHAWYYPPTNPGFRAPDGELPPLIVKSHGGPTGFAGNGLRMETQFWTSRGFAVVDVNYSGSGLFGRSFRNRLWGNWGVYEVQDCVSAVQTLAQAGLADPSRVSIVGGSAGGYTTLQSLVSVPTYACGVSRYGIGDLEALARDTHKFEARYLDRLIGPYPAARDIYLERSPIHHLDRLATPMLLLQGTDDRVVPPEQATAMAEAVAAKGIPVALLMFEGEGHGFRKLATRQQALEAELSFYSQVFGFTPADVVPRISFIK